MRNHYNEEELEAAKLLDYVKDGGVVADALIRRALWCLGGLVGVSTDE